MIPFHKFDIDEDSKKLKELVSNYESDFFLKKIADVITLIQAPRIPFKPFVSLDSPLVQLLYIASLNISSSVDKGTKTSIGYEEWNEIIKYSVAVKAGYYDALLPKENDDKEEYYKMYKIVLPVFFEYYNSGVLNFEEQEINKIFSIFSSFDIEIIENYGLSVNDFIEIYNLIDYKLIENTNYPFKLIESDTETKNFWEALRKNKKHSDEWKYNGTNTNINALIKFFKNPDDRFYINKSELIKNYDERKITLFLNLFSLKRQERPDYLYLTSPNLFIQKPLFNLNNEKYIVLEIKQLIHAIYKELTQFSKSDKLQERFFIHRGKYLQDKIEKSLKKYFIEDSYIYNEYKTSILNKGQDVLLLNKGLALIIEAKGGKEPEPRRNPDVRESFKSISQYFKKNIQKGYEQTNRVKKLFDLNQNFNIIDKKDNILYNVNTNKIHTVFSFIITLDKFREVQLNLNHLIKLDKGDVDYPISMCIDDFEVLLLAFRKKRINKQKFINMLKTRSKLNGRLESNDELEVWADLIINDNFSLPNDDNYHYSPSINGADLFDELYESGMGFENEKFMNEKKQKRIFSHREFFKKHYAQQGV